MHSQDLRAQGEEEGMTEEEGVTEECQEVEAQDIRSERRFSGRAGRSGTSGRRTRPSSEKLRSWRRL